MRRLVLMRHAHAEDLALAAGTDLTRPLSASGRRDARRMGQWLAETSVHPTHIVTSAATRAQETARETAAVLGVPAHSIVVVDQIYAAALPALMQVLEDRLHAGTLLLVGHNPGIAVLAQALARDRGDPPADLQFPPGTCAVFDLPGAGDLFQAGIVRAYAAPYQLPPHRSGAGPQGEGSCDPAAPAMTD